ncbi:MAG TPA: SH3 domain-containing protein [Polyangia bacterium]
MDQRGVAAVRRGAHAALVAVALALLAWAGAARAEEAVVSAAVVLRERPDDRAPVAARVAEGAKVSVVARSADGAWLQVKSGAKKGWATRGFFKRMGSNGAAPVPSPPTAGAAPDGPSLAPPRAQPAPPAAAAAPQPHLDNWVNRSTWTKRPRLDAEVLQRCDVHQRTDDDSRVLSTLQRGQRVVLSRMSTDEAWGLVRRDGVDVGWVSMRALRVRGEVHGGPDDDAAGETAGSFAGGTGGGAAPSSGGELAVRARPALPDRRQTIALVADGGIAVIGRRFVSNGTGPMAAYELSTTAVASGVSGAYAHRLGTLGVIGADLSYAYAAGARVQYTAGDGTPVKMRLQQHDAEGGLRLGLHSGAAGGIDAWLRAGALLTVTIIDPDATVRLQSDRLIAPTAGLGVDARHLATLGGHWLGVGLFGRAVLYGQLADNLHEGADRGTWGGRFGGDLSLELYRTPARGQLVLAAAYSYAFTVTHLSGPSQRDPTATQSTLGTAQHLVVAALGYAY